MSKSINAGDTVEFTSILGTAFGRATTKAIDLSAARYKARKAAQQATFVAMWAARVQARMSQAEMTALVGAEYGDLGLK